MKKRKEKTKEQRQREIAFIRKAPTRLKNHRRLMAGTVTKEDFVDLLAVIFKNLSKIRKEGIGEDGKPITSVVRKYRNLPSVTSFNNIPRKVLAGIYGTWLEVARKEGLA